MRARRRFGQNFLVDKNIIYQIVNSLPLGEDNPWLLEIGPGRGALTNVLFNQQQPRVAVEIDRDLAASLEEAGRGHDFFVVDNSDILEFNWGSFKPSGVPWVVVGNLPYNLSTPILLSCLHNLAEISAMYFLLQAEFVARMAADSGSKVYGRLSILVQAFCEVKKLFGVGPECFLPRPRVNSSFVRLVPRPVVERPSFRVFKQLEQVTHVAFSKRRKMLRGSIGVSYPQLNWEELGIELHLRPEDLAVADYLKIAQALVDDLA